MRVLKNRLEVLTHIHNKANDCYFVFKEAFETASSPLNVQEPYLYQHLGILLKDMNIQDLYIEGGGDIYKEIGGDLREATKNILDRPLIDIRGKGYMITKVSKAFGSLIEKMEIIGSIKEGYRKARMKNVTLVTDNNTITGYKDFTQFKNDLTAIRKYLTSHVSSPTFEINGRSVKVHIRNIDLLNGGKDLSKGGLEKTVGIYVEYVKKLKRLRILLQGSGGIPLTISSLGGEFIKKV